MNNEKDNKEKIEKNVELRVLIIGEMGVGKKSIAKRFRLLNCTETKKNLFSLKKSEDDEEEEEQVFKNNIYLSSEYEEVLLEEELKNKKREQQRLDLMRFAKFYKIDLDSIEITFYPCIEAEPLPLDYIPSNENEDNIFETKNKITLKKLINEIAQIIMKPLSNPKNHLEVLFLFCFDLGDRNTFTQLKLYYSQINKNFDLKNHFHKILVGNKLDKKNVNTFFNNSINKFIEDTSLKYYEISTFMFFSFENFLEKIFYNIFGNFKNFSEDSFKKKFHNVLEEKSTFLQSERKIYETNLNPSPNAYQNNPYEYPIKNRDLKKLFKEKQKYNKKIFINKEGPVFPPLKKKNEFKENLSDSFENKKEKEIKELLHNEKSENNAKVDIIKDIGTIIWDSDKLKEIKDILIPTSKKEGYTMGICLNNFLGLRKNRRDKNIKLNLELSEEIMEGLDLTVRKKHILKRALSQETYDNNKKKYYKNKFTNFKNNQNNINRRHKKVIEQNEQILKEKINNCIEKEKKYLKKYIKMQKAKLNQQKKLQKQNILKSFEKKALIQKACFYSPPSTITTNKGFSFGHKLQSKIKVYSPDFPNLLDDFEKVIIKNSKIQKKIKGAERFPKTKSEVFQKSEELKTIEENQKIFESKRKKFIKNRFHNFFKERKNRKKHVIHNKESLIKEDEKEFNEQIVKQYKTSNDYFAREINYNLVENSSPKYTIKGRYNIHNSLSYQSFYKSTDDIFNPYEEEDDSIYSRRRRKYQNDMLLLENPNFDNVKPRYPAFSFGSSERFKTFNANIDKKINDKNSPNIETNLYKDGNFGYQDYQSFLKSQTMMGTEKKFRCYKDNGVPGPGNYKILNFAEEISKKGDLINKIRQKIKEKENNKMLPDNNLDKKYH